MFCREIFSRNLSENYRLFIGIQANGKCVFEFRNDEYNSIQALIRAIDKFSQSSSFTVDYYDSYTAIDYCDIFGKPITKIFKEFLFKANAIYNVSVVVSLYYDAQEVPLSKQLKLLKYMEDLEISDNVQGDNQTIQIRDPIRISFKLAKDYIPYSIKRKNAICGNEISYSTVDGCFKLIITD